MKIVGTSAGSSENAVLERISSPWPRLNFEREVALAG